MKIREHRGSLDDSMTTVAEIPATLEAVTEHIRKSIPLLANTAMSVMVEPYTEDTRNGWNTHIVVIRNYGVFGFTDGPVDVPAATEELAEWEPRVKPSDFVEFKPRNLVPLPPDSNPFRYETMLSGTPLVRGWLIMHEGGCREDDPQALEYFVMCNTWTGQRVEVGLHPVTREQAMPLKHLRLRDVSEVLESWVSPEVLAQFEEATQELPAYTRVDLTPSVAGGVFFVHFAGRHGTPPLAVLLAMRDLTPLVKHTAVSED